MLTLTYFVPAPFWRSWIVFWMLATLVDVEVDSDATLLFVVKRPVDSDATLLFVVLRPVDSEFTPLCAVLIPVDVDVDSELN
ncbi:hypothetical protein BGV71_13900 [Burkholderia ubonensis]|nr:hypothetical protein BGV71_13900 [Burkholderia ubonensis]